LSAKFDPHLRNNAKMRLLIHYYTHRARNKYSAR